jgi:hypothetical protein
MRGALLRSYKDFLRYLLAPDGMALPRRNICSLFGSEKNYVDQLDRIEMFLRERQSQIGAGGKAIDLIIFFWGHGYFSSEGGFYLALRAYDPRRADRTGVPISQLAKVIRNEMGSARRYWLLDCCYADGALSAALGSEVTVGAATASHSDLARSILASELEEPLSGSTVLSAADRDNKAWVFRRDSRSLFTDLLMSALAAQDGGEGALSLQDVERRMQATLEERRRDKNRYPDYHDYIVPPRCTDPDRAQGQISQIPLFPPIAIPAMEARRRIGELLDLDPKALTFLLVEAEGKSSNFETEAYNGIVEREYDIEKAARGSETSLEGLPPFDAEAHVKTLSVKDAFGSWPHFLDCVKVLCRADVVVFDVTDFQPGTMLLLGIRSVAKRGVTVCSIDSPSLEAYRAPLPFCIQVLNVSSHSMSGPDRGQHPRELIAQKIIEGLSRKRANPYYLDLPSYDAVRRLGTTIEHYRPVPYDEQVLFLCPFSPEYVAHCWKGSIERFFKPRLIARHNRDFRQSRQQAIDPELRRLLDRGSPQIVSQSFYEAVRRTQMCIADWTNLRPNLFFELGVRLACNPLGAVHVIADGNVGRTAGGSFRHIGTEWGSWPVEKETAEEVVKFAQLRHVKLMRERFTPLPYRIGSASEAYDRMVARHLKSAASSETDGNRVYATIAKIMGTISEVDPEIGVEEELLQKAAMLGGTDDFYKFTSALHADANTLIGERANNAALERIMAAWLYIDARYPTKAIADDPELFLRYQTLYVAIAGRGRGQFQPELMARVESGYQDVVALEPAIADEPFGLFEKGVSNLLNISKLRKDERNYEGAIGELETAVRRLDRSSWHVKPTSREPTREQRAVARLLTDAHGMIGGHYRRLNQPESALANFDCGRQFEKNPRFEIESTYNTVNWLVTKIELEPESHKAISSEIHAATGLLDGHTKGRRNQDAWAWADLGTCQLLSLPTEKVDQALASFQKFAQLCDRDSLGSPVRVIEMLHASLSRAGLQQSANTQRAIDWFHALGAASS